MKIASPRGEVSSLSRRRGVTSMQTPLSRLTATAPPKGSHLLSYGQFCTSQQILDTNHKKIYNKKFSVSQISVRNATCDIELASDSLTNKLDAVH